MIPKIQTEFELYGINQFFCKKKKTFNQWSQNSLIITTINEK